MQQENHRLDHRALSGWSGRKRAAVMAAVLVALLGGAAIAGSALEVYRTSTAESGTPIALPHEVSPPAHGALYPGTYSASLLTTMPKDLFAAPKLSAACQHASQLPDASTGPASEDAKRGDPSWRRYTGLNPSRVALYLDVPSATCGETIGVHVRGSGPVRLRAFRVGGYRGAGARLVWSSAVFPARAQRIRGISGPTRLSTQEWPITTTLTVEPTWVPGFYLIAAVDSAGRAGSLAPLVVRDEAGRAPLVLMASDLTWQAYNGYGGHSLYLGSGRSHDERLANRSFEVGFHRPYQGSGTQQFLSMDLPIVRFLQAHHLRVDIVTATDVDARPSLLAGRAGIVIPGHSEYWTSRIYDAVEAARNSGTNIANLGGNEAYWQARLTRDSEGDPLTEIVYRAAALDPVGRSRPLDTTVRWADGPLRRSQSQLTGAGFSGVSVFGPERVMDGTSWLLRGTGVHAGQVLDDIAGNEVDSVLPLVAGQEDPRTPPNIGVILEGAFPPPGEHPGLTTMTVSYYTTPSGAGVFNAGTTYWACNLDSSCPLQSIGRTSQAVVDQMTLTALTAFSRPRAGLTHPSTAHPPVAPAAMAALLGPLEMGRRHAPRPGAPDAPD
ncbi:MAG: N,N-dimethylformamidase beta subunit family domain-containing protein [Nostocoides sp.]